MSINSLGQYSPTHKVHDHYGNVLPPVEHSEGIRPAIDAMPAAWLPVRIYDKKTEDWVVVPPGKMLAADPDGRLMPAHYGLTSATVTYTADDVEAGVIDVATGQPVTAAKTVNLDQLTGVKHGSWTRATAGTGSITSGFMGRFGEAFDDATQKYPLGVSHVPILQWAGDGSSLDDGFNPVGYRLHNYNRQHRVSFVADYVLRLPVIPAQAASESMSNTWEGSTITPGTADGWRNRTWIQATARYDSSSGEVPVLDTYPVAALPLDEYPVAKHTTRTTMSSTVSGLLVNERSLVSDVTQSGDFFVDYDVGVLFVYSSGGSTLPSVGGSDTITYYHYAGAPSVLSRFASVLPSASGLNVGDFLKCGTESNWVVATPATDNICDIMGQVIGFEDHPKDYLEYVRTLYDPAISTSDQGSMANATLAGSTSTGGQFDQLPGSATDGMPDLVTFSGAANRIALVNLISR